MIDCRSCGSTHMGRDCGLSFIERLRTTQIHPDALPTREKKKYWDQQALNDQFGEEATERSLELTDGKGMNRPLTSQETAKLFE